MTSRARAIAVAAALLAAAAILWTWWNAPERRLSRRLDALVERLEKDGDDSGLIAAAAAKGVLDFFAPGFLVRARPYDGSLAGPQELMGGVMRLRGAAPRVAVTASDRAVEIASGGRTGTIVFVGTVVLDRPGAGAGRESWRVRSLWIEDGGEWRVAELELVERLERGPLSPF